MVSIEGRLAELAGQRVLRVKANPVLCNGMKLNKASIVAFGLVLMATQVFAAAEHSCGAPATGDFISYTVEPQLTDGPQGLLVHLRFRLQGRTGVVLVLPSEWQGLTKLYASVQNVTGVSASTTVDEIGDPARRRISFRPGTIVSVDYVYAPSSAGPNNTFFAPQLDANHLALTGRNFLVYPDIDEHEPISVSIAWTGFASNWVLADNLAATGSCHEATKLLDLSNGMFIGGDFRLTRAPLEGVSVYLAIRGKWAFTDDEFARLAAKIVTAERGFWGDRRDEHYLMALVPIEQPAGEYAGTAVENAFLMQMSPGTPIGLDTDFLLAHEIFHAWNPGQLGEVKSDPVYWFGEGFTDYYAWRFLLLTKLISSEQYVDAINRSYSEYVSSPARNLAKEKVVSQYFTDASAQRVPYLQGSLIALKWNARIVERTHGRQTLDDAMRTLRQQARQSEQILTDETLASFFATYAGPEVAADVRAIALGSTIPLPADGLGNCFEVVKRPLFVFDPGFAIDALYRNGIIRGVREGGPAYQAGLRDGQIVIRNSTINPNDPNQAIELTLTEQMGTKTVTYLPRTSGSDVDQFIEKADHAQCGRMAFN